MKCYSERKRFEMSLRNIQGWETVQQDVSRKNRQLFRKGLHVVGIESRRKKCVVRDIRGPSTNKKLQRLEIRRKDKTGFFEQAILFGKINCLKGSYWSCCSLLSTVRRSERNCWRKTTTVTTRKGSGFLCAKWDSTGDRRHGTALQSGMKSAFPWMNTLHLPLLWHFDPMNPGVHLQSKPFARSKHEPPFWHGLSAHSFMSVKVLVHQDLSYYNFRLTVLTTVARETRFANACVLFVVLALAVVWAQRWRTCHLKFKLFQSHTICLQNTPRQEQIAYPSKADQKILRCKRK